MSNKIDLGGNRLGSGGKNEVSFKNYERSTHNLGYTWRSSMSAGTLVPFMKELALPGDNFDIDLDCNVMTLPTIGPLFGSYKVQIDVFQIPIRLYNKQMMSNTLNIGLKMQNVYLPQIEMDAMAPTELDDLDNCQINPSSIFAHLDMRGLGTKYSLAPEYGATVTRKFNGVPYLAYWDIYKNYYANKQEEIGAVIHNNNGLANYDINEMIFRNDYGDYEITSGIQATSPLVTFTEECNVYISWILYENVDYTKIEILVSEPDGSNERYVRLYDIFNNYNYDESTMVGQFSGFHNYAPADIYLNFNRRIKQWRYNEEVVERPNITTFPLENIDNMRNLIMTQNHTSNLIIDHNDQAPYGLALSRWEIPASNVVKYSKTTPQEGLALKTYQSDLFNNWMNTEWIDGDNGINAITAIDTSAGNFSIDTLNLSKKIYDMLNRIALSGGSYDDWLNATYSHERVKEMQNPMYIGGLSRELSFQEVISTTGTENEPLGTLAGRGRLTQKKKGGSIKVRIDEPSYIMGIVSLTPRLDYSQGNKWDVNLNNMNDLHKPALDEIGFQDLITDQMAWWDTKYDSVNGILEYKSAGKQPAWINYMTNVNVVKGNFAIETQEMFMTLNRRYETQWTMGLCEGIKDLTTYIDPAKYNYIFANTRLDAQNFWMQIGVDIVARRKMSARVIPNL